MAIIKKDEMMELGKFFISEIVYDGCDPVKEYILKNKRHMGQYAESKVTLVKCLKTANSMKAKGASKDELLRMVTYAYVLLETEEYTMDLKKAKEDLQIDILMKKYAA